ncbi:PfaB family protein [Parashewanella curva]|uniref:PfaB family protein n=1 Tax=Parashewanella curva TaxID=2338552 RepID=A0A3L8PVF1_9GAMM|nr:PfaB family protein [Parashewanella curva]RLV59405.1 PfaB family protein [Parashewanella curva]
MSASLDLRQLVDVQRPLPLVAATRLFYIITGTNIDEVLSQAKELSVSTDFLGSMRVNLLDYQAQQPLALVLQAPNPAQLHAEIKAFEQAALDNQRKQDWQFTTPNGSCFYSKPPQNKGLTFVYPGVGTAYPNMFLGLHQYFPRQFAQLATKLDLNALLQANVYYTKNANPPTLSQQAIAGVGVSYLLSQLLLEEFNLQPKFALGYSMGETAMWASLGVWKQPETLIDATANSDIFQHQISGSLAAVKELWQLGSDENISWNSFYVAATADEITQALTDFPRAYLAISHKDTCIIAGEEQACRDLLKAIGKRGIATNMVTAMHTPASQLVKEDIQQFYQQPITEKVPDIKFISASQSEPLDIQTINPESIATSIANTFTQPLDFSHVINKAISYGSRIFVELGADRQTTTLINKQLQDAQEYHTIALNSKGQDTVTSLLNGIAKLISLRVPLSIDALTTRFTPVKESH